MDVLDHCSDLLLQYGGHHQAAGCSVHIDNFDKFQKKANDFVRKIQENTDTSQYISADTIMDIVDIHEDMYDQIQTMKPFGMGNEKPTFLIRNIPTNNIRFLGKEQKHIKITDPSGVDFLGFHFGEYMGEIQKSAHIDII